MELRDEKARAVSPGETTRSPQAGTVGRQSIMVGQRGNGIGDFDEK